MDNKKTFPFILHFIFITAFLVLVSISFTFHLLCLLFCSMLVSPGFRQATEHLNPVPVITVDQPLYAIAKKIQWTWPRIYGEDKFVVMMGGLHIEMALLKSWREVDGQV